MRVGTCCSGTDSPIVVFDSLRSVLRSDLDIDLCISHSFSSECNAKKQQYIRHCFPKLQHLFVDTRQLGQSHARNLVTNSDDQVPSADGLIGGFPRTASSKLNPHWHEEANRTCCEWRSCHWVCLWRHFCVCAAAPESSAFPHLGECPRLMQRWRSCCMGGLWESSFESQSLGSLIVFLQFNIHCYSLC